LESGKDFLGLNLTVCRTNFFFQGVPLIKGRLSRDPRIQIGFEHKLKGASRRNSSPQRTRRSRQVALGVSFWEGVCVTEERDTQPPKGRQQGPHNPATRERGEVTVDSGRAWRQGENLTQGVSVGG